MPTSHYPVLELSSSRSFHNSACAFTSSNTLLLISMDEFAQTRGGDDLFDDDFTPITEPGIQSFESPPQAPRARVSPQGRNISAPMGKEHRRPDNAPRQPQSKPIATAVAAKIKTTNTGDAPPEQNATSQEEPDPTSLPIQQPQAPQIKPPTAVRGDRTATGGTIKPKLTEDELSARLAAAKLNNAKRAEAHRLAEADEASFQQREAHATQKRKEEGQAKRVMNMEREKNRLRKLGAQAGREWDEGKEEAEKREDRGSQYRRGAHGGVAYDSGRGGGGGGFRGGGSGYQNGDYNQDFREQRGGYRERGRGRGERADRGRGGGRGRGSLITNNNSTNKTSQVPPDPVADFPALPTTSKGTQPRQAKPPDTPLSPAAEGGSWADEVQAAKA